MILPVQAKAIAWKKVSSLRQLSTLTGVKILKHGFTYSILMQEPRLSFNPFNSEITDFGIVR